MALLSVNDQCRASCVFITAATSHPDASPYLYCLILLVRSSKIRRLFRFGRAMHNVAEAGKGSELCTVFARNHEAVLRVRVCTLQVPAMGVIWSTVPNQGLFLNGTWLNRSIQAAFTQLYSTEMSLTIGDNTWSYSPSFISLSAWPNSCLEPSSSHSLESGWWCWWSSLWSGRWCGIRFQGWCVGGCGNGSSRRACGCSWRA